MKKAINNVSFILGFVFLLGGLFLYGLEHIGNISLLSNGKLPVVLIIMGIGFLVGGTCEVFLKGTKQMQIEAKDERNISIGQAAKSTGFDVMAILLSTAMLILVLFDYISMGAFLTLFVVFAVGQIAFLLKLWHLQKSM